MAKPGDPQEWIGGRRAAPFDIVRAAHAELLVTDLARSREFYVDLLGFVVTEEDDSTIYLRGYEDRHHHCLVLRSATAAVVGHLAFLVASDLDLERAARHYRSAGCFPRWLEAGEEQGQGRGLRVEDQLGCPLEFYSEMEMVPSLLQRYHLYRGARVQRLDHFNLHVPDVQRAFDLYHGLGFGCSEYIGGDGDDRTIFAAWMFRKPHVHDVALTAGRGPRLHHVGFWTADTDAILNACDALGGAGRQDTIERGPGRHGVSNAFYLYLRDPDGHRVELYTADYWTGDPDLVPVRWSVTHEQRRSFWGHTVPERWYLESSLLQAADGSPVPLSDPPVQEASQPLLPR